ncbi:MAG: flavodoxin family protein [Methanomicrobiales archaeon]|nr:flavodoxin family protein [Methanomicrobiales archaeon]
MFSVSIPHSNEGTFAEARADEIGADLLSVDAAASSDLAAHDLIGFGSGIFFGKHHRSLLEYIEQLPQMDGKKAFIFSTSGKGEMELNAHLRELLTRKGFIILGEFACKGWDSWGPFRIIGGINKGRPDEKDLEAAKTFARNLKEICRME